MANLGDAAKAERLSQRRPRMLMVLTVIFLAQQASFFSRYDMGDRPVDHVKISAWLVTSICIVVMLATGGAWGYSRNVRRLLNDEATTAFRDQSLRIGFLASMIACIVFYFVSLIEPLGGRTAIHAIMSVGIATTLICFAFLERRALRGG